MSRRPKRPVPGWLKSRHPLYPPIQPARSELSFCAWTEVSTIGHYHESRIPTPIRHMRTAMQQRNTQEPKHFIFVRRSGQLANRLVLSANFVAFVEEYGHCLVNVAFHRYAHLFLGTSRDLLCRYPIPASRHAWDPISVASRVVRATGIFYRTARLAGTLHDRHRLFGGHAVTLREDGRSPTTLLKSIDVQSQIARARLIFVQGWNFRAPDLVERHAEKIRQYFQPVQEIDQRSKKLLAHLRDRADVVVGVHVRHGDYREFLDGRFFFPASRYAAWMSEFVAQFAGQRVAFLVCSNEPRNRQEFPGLDVDFGSEVAAVDLHALAGCDYIFGPQSTFSQWASFVGKAPVFHVSDAKTPLDRSRFRISYFAEIPGIHWPTA